MGALAAIKDITVYAGVIAFVFWQWVCTRHIRWRSVSWRPPRWVFAVVWPLLYACLSAAWLLVIYTGDDAAHPPEYYSAFFGLLLAHLVLNKAWTWLASAQRDGWALLVALLLLLTAVAMLVLLGLAQSWVALGLLVPNALWLAVALYLNARFLFGLRKTMVLTPEELIARRRLP